METNKNEGAVRFGKQIKTVMGIEKKTKTDLCKEIEGLDENALDEIISGTYNGDAMILFNVMSYLGYSFGLYKC